MQKWLFNVITKLSKFNVLLLVLRVDMLNDVSLKKFENIISLLQIWKILAIYQFKVLKFCYERATELLDYILQFYV